MRCTKMPGRWTASGSNVPVSTISSTSTTVILPACATFGLKLRAVRRNIRLPDLSAFQALTSETSGISAQLHHVLLAVELADLLAVGHDGADAGLGEERRDAGAAGAQLLGQRALRREVELQFAGQVLALELLVLADVARDHLADLARREQLAEAEAVDARVVGDDRQVLDAASRAARRSAPRECRRGRSRRRPAAGRP